ncbi:DUF4175 family protein [Tamlana fucoidanivorans]|uniref:DUF4175 family protein n=1 Tax=Allotamlana fucoidanivorans TaxID=2583814 RepID=A0A5C4SRK8_9FLAO|nr:DUF4175 family protein [Tamlana fucoidanivorans]TNJ47066.1 DUF4175 family protein [Tamlana fucoidanivorans]
MSHFEIIQQKLEAFIRRYYTNELLRGGILFFAMGLLYLLVTLFIEYVFWMGTLARTLLFWIFIVVELALLTKFIFIPLAKLLRLKQGIDYIEASKLIGKHFPEVNDKLLNVLQLSAEQEHSELLLASIEQKSSALTPIPFKLAVNFKSNLSYLKYAAIPVVIILASLVFGNLSWFKDSYERVTHYKTAYEPPAPFQFFIDNNDLKAIENQDFRLLVRTIGEVSPENAKISYNDETYYLQQLGVGVFEYVFAKPKANIRFQLVGNTIVSKPYILEVVATPSIIDFEMQIDYPSYTLKPDEVVTSTGNATVPEGSQIKWILKTKATEEVVMLTQDTISFKKEKEDLFTTSKKVLKDFAYSLSTSNENLKDFEKLDFTINSIKDEHPEISLRMTIDSTNHQSLYFYGQVSDDYGLSKLQLVYYPQGTEAEKEKDIIPLTKANIQDFISVFPNNLNIEPGIPYELYFQVFDNDQVNGHKSVKSNIYTYRKLTKEEEERKNLKEQEKSIEQLSKSLNKFDEQEEKRIEVTQTQKEKSNLNFNDKGKLKSFLKRQKEQDEMMKEFNKNFQKRLEEFEKEHIKNDQFTEDLKKRLEENEKKLEQDEKLLKEIEKIQEKIGKEELINKLDELGKQNKNKKRSLEQLLELTKRFYVEQKLEKLKRDLDNLSEAQESLSSKDQKENTKETQDNLNKNYNHILEELNQLEKSSKQLKKPIDIPRDQLDENEVKKDQESASDFLEELEEQDTQELKNERFKKAQKQQRNAAIKMKELSKKMQKSMQASGGEQIQEDMEMLRQVLDNVVLFSFNQEALMNKFKQVDPEHNELGKYLKKQNSLREHFEYIDDSLFALSLRQPKLSEEVNKEITEVYYNIDKVLQVMADGQMYQGISSQQFTVTAANNLADILSDILDNMQESLSMSEGQGGQGDMQLPDIIMSQEELNKMMEEGMKQGQSKGDQTPDKGKQGNNTENNEEGESKGEKKNGSNKVDEEGYEEGQEALIYEIYKQQQELKEALRKRMVKEGFKGNSEALIRRMEHIEMDLLNNGITNETLNKMLDLKHQLLKLERAVLEQGEDDSRESNTNKKVFQSQDNDDIERAKQYFESTEILNRQSLPLHSNYKEKVKAYFKNGND